jgi:glycogen phosphorylase
VEVDPGSIFDVQVKRIHEYKRQLLNVLHIAHLYLRQKADPSLAPVPRTFVFGGKAAPGYAMAKLSIRLIHAIARRVAGDPLTRGKLNVAFLPNYSVSLAEIVFPACELSEQISTAGTEASGTGNMKAALNGALTIGTLDGANVEIREEVGPDNIFIFGHTKDEIEGLRSRGYSPDSFIRECEELRRAIEIISGGELDDRSGLFRPIVDALTGEDRYFLCADFASYAECQRRAASVYARPDEWWRMSILNVAGMGKFSSDRTTRQYAEEIWDARPVPVLLDGGRAEEGPTE